MPRYPYNHLTAVRHLRASHPKMEALVARVGRFQMPLEPHQHPYHSLLRAIAFQQLNGTAAATILGRVNDQIGGGDFPAPERMLAASDEALRGCGLSRQKIAAMRDLAAKAQEGAVPHWEEMQTLSDEEIISRLTAVRGVGVWTVQMMLIFRLGRPDVWPTLDYGVQQGYQIAFNKRRLPKPKELAAAGERWRPYRSVASWYLWQAVRLKRAQAPSRTALA